LSVEDIASLISGPGADSFFEKKGEEELEICCKYSWVAQNISRKVKLREGEIEILTNLLETSLLIMRKTIGLRMIVSPGI